MEQLALHGLWEFHTRPYVSHGRRPNGSWGLTERVPAEAAGQYPEIARRAATSWAAPWQEDGAV